MTCEDQRIEARMLRTPAHVTPAIYFLSDGENVIYVGQSHDVKRRLARHNIKYVYAWYESCDPNSLDNNEAAAMRLHRPALNQNANGRA